MRFSAPVLVLALVLAAPSAHAQFRNADAPGDRGGRPPVRTHADSTMTLRGARQVWGHAGVGWLQSPSDIRSRYSAGLGASGSGDLRFYDRLALRARIDYQDLPSTQSRLITVNGTTYVTNEDFGHGWVGVSQAGVAVRTWNHLWIEGAAGGGYFQDGFRGSNAYENPTTGELLPLTGSSGWGPAWTIGARFEFQPATQTRLLAEFEQSVFSRGDMQLRMLTLRLGCRAF
jgi:hypothetical protein